MKTKILSVIGIAIFAYIVYKVGINNIIDSLIHLNLETLIIITILLALYFVLTTLKWKSILKIQNINLDFFTALKIYLIGNFYGFITPGTVGSLIRAKYIKDITKQDSLVSCTSSIIIERILDFMIIVLLAIPGILLVTKEFTQISINLVILISVLMLIGAVVIMKKPHPKVRELLYKFTPKKYREFLQQAFHNFYDSIPKRRKMIIPLILTVSTWLLLYTEIFILAKSLSMNVPYFKFITFTSIATLISLIPITISGLGTREATWIILFKPFGVTAAQIIALTLINLFIGSVIPSIVGFFLSISYKEKK